MVFNLFLFILGLSTGSFLNVVIDRLAKSQNLFGRSYCDYCRRTINPLYLVPIISFFLLAGRSACCGQKLSWYYPMVEFLTGAAFVLGFVFFNHPDGLMKFLMLGILACLIVIFFTDLKYQIIPDEILIVLAIFVWPFVFVNLKNHLAAALVLWLFFFLIHIGTSGRAMGFGDVKFVPIIGLFQGLKMGILSVYLAFILGGLIGVVLMIFGRKRRKSKIPFGPFLVLGMILTVFFEKSILNFLMMYLDFYPLNW